MALHLIRHAEAGPRPDEERALDATGRAQAERLAELLSTQPITRILSSRYTRCVETITPLADRLGLPVEHHRDLAEEADVEAAWALLASLSDENAVLCSHGNIISPILDRVHRRGAEIIATEWSCHKASVWVLEPDFSRATLLP